MTLSCSAHAHPVPPGGLPLVVGGGKPKVAAHVGEGGLAAGFNGSVGCGSGAGAHARTDVDEVVVAAAARLCALPTQRHALARVHPSAADARSCWCAILLVRGHAGARS